MKARHSVCLMMLPMSFLIAAPRLSFSYEEDQGRITGRVISDQGRRVKYAHVQLYRIRGNETVFMREARSDGKGQFVFENIAPGRYRVHAHQTGFLNTGLGQESPEVVVEANREVGPIEIILQTGAAIEGRVVDEDGEPIVQAEVTARRRTEGGFDFASSSQTDDRGVYRISSLPPGNYLVSVSLPTVEGKNSIYSTRYFPGVSSERDAQPISLAAGAEATGIDFSIKPEEGARVVGRIALRKNAKPVVGALVRLSPTSGAPLSTVSGKDGEFQFSGLPEGQYYLQVEPTDGQFLGISQPILVGSQPTTRADVWLDEGGEVSGRVHLVGSRTLEPSRLSLHVQMTMIETPNAVYPYHNSRINPDGTFRFGGLPAGKLRFVLSSSDRRFFLKKVLVNGADLTDSEISLGAGEKIRDIYLLISDEVGEVSGIVTDADEDIGSIRIIMVPEDPAKWGRYENYIHAYTSGTASFSLEGVPSGRYLVFALPSEVPFEGERFIQEYYASATAITVQARRTKEIQVKLLRLRP